MRVSGLIALVSLDEIVQNDRMIRSSAQQPRGAKPFIRYHRRISLAVLAFWLVQALTGVLIVFHWEIDDALLPGSRTTLNLPAIEDRINDLALPRSGVSIGSLWESGSGGNRFDLYLDGPEGSSVVRIDGEANILRTRKDGERVRDGGWIDTLVLLHHNLLLGNTGDWIVGISGILLATNLSLGLISAWPRRGTWRQVLLPKFGKGAKVAQTYSWHRALGLWAVVPALAMAASGVFLVFQSTVETLVNPQVLEAPEQSEKGGQDVGFAAAVATALAAFPDARLSGVSLPSDGNGIYRVRMVQDGEMREFYGTTTVLVRAADGVVVARQDALDDGASRSFVDGFFPFHTGQMGGVLGRVAVLAVGLWLLVMIGLGALLWWRRRSAR